MYVSCPMKTFFKQIFFLNNNLLKDDKSYFVARRIVEALYDYAPYIINKTDVSRPVQVCNIPYLADVYRTFHGNS